MSRQCPLCGDYMQRRPSRLAKAGWTCHCHDLVHYDRYEDCQYGDCLRAPAYLCEEIGDDGTVLLREPRCRRHQFGGDVGQRSVRL